MAFRRSSFVGRICIGALLGALLLFPWTPRFPQLSAAPGKANQPPQADGSGNNRVSGIKVQSDPGGAVHIDVAMSGAAHYQVSHLTNPNRLVVDVQGVRSGKIHHAYPSNSQVLKRVRVGQYQSEGPPIVRVVADLQGDPSSEVHVTSDGLRIELKPRDYTQAIVPLIQPVAAQQPAAGAVQPAQQMPPVQGNIPQQPIPVGLGAPPSVFFTSSPLKSLSQNQRLLDSLGIRIVLNLNYRKGAANDASWKTTGLPGVEASRLFIKPLGAGNYRTIELAVTQSPQSGFDLAVYGTEVTGSSQGPNPEFAQLQALVNEEVAKASQAPPPTTDLTQLNYQTYYLSYVVADRAIALLKTLGYTTVEFNEQTGDSLYDKIYNPIKLGTGHPPVIVKLIDSTKTSLMEPANTGSVMPGQPVGAPPVGAGAVGGFGGASSAVPQIGGTYLEGMTSGEPQQRLLILYDKNDPESLQSLINLLQSTIDVPSRQIMIEALVIELNANRERDLGVTFEGQHNNISDYGTSTALSDPSSASTFLPFQFTFTRGAAAITNFTATLNAMLTKGEAQVLSNPSVLVLDDRQARIQIGQQIPVTQQVTSVGTTVASASYFPVGIVLNLRPRINEDGSEITMQTETIVSSVNKSISSSLGGVLQAPTIDNRQVQSIVRVADNTPFIIGGLISTNDTTSTNGIPLLSEIPGVGALFRSTTVSKEKQEVIIVITPHVVPLEDKYFSYVIPKDSSLFDRPNYKLYRNAYRIRGEDLFDLEFVYDSNVYKHLVSRVKQATVEDPELKKEEPYASLLNGGAPGEDILVRRMLWGIIHRTGYEHYITPDQMLFFRDNAAAFGGTGFSIDFLAQELKKAKGGQNTLTMTFDANPQGTSDRSFVPPKAILGFQNLTVQDYMQALMSGNARNPDGTPKNWEILVNKEQVPGVLGATPLEVLQGALVLKRVLELNKDLPLTLHEFRAGRQIIFPSQEELTSRYHQVDREVAELFYEIYNYYPAFEQEFNRQTRQMNAELDKIDHTQQ